MITHLKRNDESFLRPLDRLIKAFQPSFRYKAHVGRV
jgi:hypothetical protein